MRKGLLRSKIASFSVMTALIASVLVGIALIAVGYKITVGSGKLSDEQACHLSIFAADQASAIRRRTLDVFDMVPNLECDPKEIVFDPKDARRTRRGRIDDDILKGKIAQELARCWNMVGQGDLNPFQGAWPQSDKTFCMTCSTLRFSEDFQEVAQSQGYRLEGLKYWMSTRRLPGKEVSFYEHMFKRIPSTSEIEEMNQRPDSWPLDQEYFLVWRFERQDTKLEGMLGIFAGAAGVVMGNPLLAAVGFGVAFQSDGVTIMQGVYMLPEEQLSGQIRFQGASASKDTCTIMLN